MAAHQSVALKHWGRIIKRWSVDKIRPETVSFQANMQRRIDRITNPSLNAAATSVKGNGALVTATPTAEFSEAKAMKQANALYTLLENRYSTAFPMPPQFRHPASRQTHYDDLLRELEEAPSRSKFDSYIKKLKGRFRLG